MNSEFTQPGRWSRRRWWLALAVVFGAHVGLIFALGNHKPVVPRQPGYQPQLRLAVQTPEFLALADPTLFALPHLKSFSAPVWLETPASPSQHFQWNEPFRWLDLQAGQLGEAFSSFMQTNEVEQPALSLKPVPELTMPRAAPTAITQTLQSTMRIDGALAQRTLLNPPQQLPSWPAADLLKDSVVEVVVDNIGHVMTTKLLPGGGMQSSFNPLISGSGSKDADKFAIDMAKVMKFAPLPREVATRWTSGSIIFQWRTVPLSATNGATVNP